MAGMSAETSNPLDRAAALIAIVESPGISTIDLLDRLGLAVVADSLAWLHAQGRIAGFGQDLDGRWWTADDTPRSRARTGRIAPNRRTVDSSPR